MKGFSDGSTAHLVLTFEHADFQTPCSQLAGADETVMATAYDDRVELRFRPHAC